LRLKRSRFCSASLWCCAAPGIRATKFNFKGSDGIKNLRPPFALERLGAAFQPVAKLIRPEIPAGGAFERERRLRGEVWIGQHLARERDQIGLARLQDRFSLLRLEDQAAMVATCPSLRILAANGT
jgi:hypothetical protein